MLPVWPRIVALLLGLATVLPSAAFARTHYFCRMMDRVMASPCCDAERQKVDAREEARAPDCCVRISASGRDVAPATRSDVAFVPAATLLATISEPVYVPPAGRDVAPRTAQARAPPLLGPPLFLAHCSFLI